MSVIKLDGVSLNYRIPKPLTLSRLLTPGVEPRSTVVPALKNLSFSLEAGERLGLVGANGAGKSTLLKLLYGIYEPDQGSVQVNGQVNALFNINLGFRPEATGRRNIRLRGLMQGWSEEEIEKRTNEIIEFSELGEFIDLPYKTYSQGMAARLAFATATALKPDILLMDEWIGAGDPAFQRKARARMTRLADRASAIILASHNLNLLRKTCTRILELEKGKRVALLPTKIWFKRRGKLHGVNPR